jgi:hypothetical protein
MAVIDEIATGLSFLPFRFSRNKSSHNIEAADTELADRSGLKYYLELQIPEYNFFGDFIPLHRSEGREVPVLASQDGSTYEGATFDYNDKYGKLDGNLEFIKPTYNSNKLMTVVNQTMQYRLREIVNQTTPVIDTDTLLPSEWIIKAGLSPVDYSEYKDTFFSIRQASKRQFLTWQPNEIFVGKEERWLSFLINFSPKSTTIHLRVRYILPPNTRPIESGDGSVVSTFESISGLNIGQIVVCPVGVQQLNIPAGVPWYEVWLSNENNQRISEVRKYYIDTLYRPQERAITFVNSLGGWDTIRFTGIGNEVLKINRQKVERERPAGATIDFADTFIISADGEEEMTVSTGTFERLVLKKQKHFQDLLFSEKIYLQTNRGHQYLDLLVNQIEKNRDLSDIIAYTLSFKKSGVFQNHSDCEPAAINSIRPTAWRGIDYDHVLDAYGKRTGRVKPRRLEKIYSDDLSQFKPKTVKPNIAGTDGFIDDLILPDAATIKGTTPFPSALIDRNGTFLRTNCIAGGTPGFAQILVIAGKYGGEKAGDADKLAEAEALTMDTQAFADTNGACYPDPWSYVISVPIDKAHFRISHKKTPGSSYGENYVVKSNANGSTKKGNGWFLQLNHAGQTDVYQSMTWDIQLPTNFAPDQTWKFGVYGPSATGVEIYVNGAMVYSGNNSFDPDEDDFVTHEVAHNLIPSQAKVYIRIIA